MKVADLWCIDNTPVMVKKIGQARWPRAAIEDLTSLDWLVRTPFLPGRGFRDLRHPFVATNSVNVHSCVNLQELAFSAQISGQTLLLGPVALRYVGRRLKWREGLRRAASSTVAGVGCV